MGQAKGRGTREQRIKDAKQRYDSMRPESLKCNHCGAEISDITALDTKGMKGINAAFGGICAGCTQTTWAISGKEEAVAELLAVIEEDSGGEAKHGYISK